MHSLYVCVQWFNDSFWDKKFYGNVKTSEKKVKVLSPFFSHEFLKLPLFYCPEKYLHFLCIILNQYHYEINYTPHVYRIALKNKLHYFFKIPFEKQIDRLSFLPKSSGT